MVDGPLVAGQYRLVAEIGRGGFGVVWRARDERLGRDVAAKQLYLPMYLSAGQRAEQHDRSLREARSAARLRHPNAVTVHDLVIHNDTPWLIMELLPGRALDTIVKSGGPLSPRDTAEMGLAVLGALRAAHAAGVIHRDVKPANVLIGEGRTVLTDFGIAMIEGDEALTQSGTVMGAPAYTSPERARGEPAVPASDLWSLGATLFYAVEGRRPFQGTNPNAIFHAVINDEPASTRHAGPLAPVIGGLLQKNPAERLTADEVAEMLADICGLPAPPSEPATVPGRAARRRWTRRRTGSDNAGLTWDSAPLPGGPAASGRAADGAASGRAGAGAARRVGAASGQVGDGADPRGARVGTRTRGTEGGPPWRRADTRPGRGGRRVGGVRRRLLVTAAVPLAAGVAVAGVLWTRPGETGRGRTAVQQRAAAPPPGPALLATLPADPGGATAVAFSPDGATLAVGSQGGPVRLWTTATRASRTVLTGHAYAVFAAAFSPDGRTLATAGYDGRILLWDVAAGRRTETITTGANTITSLAFSPDGRRLASSSDSSLWLWNLRASPPARSLTLSDENLFTTAYSRSGALAVAGTRSLRLLLPGGSAPTRIGAVSSVFRTMAFSPDGRTLACGTTDGRVRLWDIAARRVVATFPGSGASINAVAYDATGTRLASADGTTVLLWDPVDHRRLAALSGHSGLVGDVAFDPRGGLLAVAGATGVDLWSIRH